MFARFFSENDEEAVCAARSACKSMKLYPCLVSNPDRIQTIVLKIRGSVEIATLHAFMDALQDLKTESAAFREACFSSIMVATRRFSSSSACK